MRISAVLKGVQPSLGCTEPGAIALACALARRAVGGNVQRISVVCDPNVFKNALAVAVPGTSGLCGIPIAAALGALAGDPDLRLEVLTPVEADDVRRAQQLVTGGRVDCRVDRGYRGIHIEATVQTGSGTGRAVIEGNPYRRHGDHLEWGSCCASWLGREARRWCHATGFPRWQVVAGRLGAGG